MRSVITVILAGGVGSRLGPLTNHRAKSAVEIAAKYRIIDFMMSNCLNSGLQHILVATQYRSHELNKHLSENWPSNAMHEFYVQTVPAQQILGEMWYRGTADAVYQNLDIITKESDAKTIAVLSGDHVLAMDFRQMHDFHKVKESVFTVCVMPVPIAEASRFGIVEVDTDWRVIGFDEKPEYPKEIPGRSGFCLASMGNYFAELDFLKSVLGQNAENPNTGHDFGKDIIPEMLTAGMSLYAYNYLDNEVSGQKENYWRDVGTVQALWEANMDLVCIKPELNIYNKKWPIRSAQNNLPPAKFNETTKYGCRIRNSVVSGGCIIEDADLFMAVLGRDVRVYGSTIEESVLFSGVKVKNDCVLKRVIVDSDVRIPPGTHIGVNHDNDSARGLYVDDSGIVIVPQGYVFK